MKKGFTLIELLAVILVLAIIALIAIPVVTNIIEDAKKGASVDGSYSYISTIEKQMALSDITKRPDYQDNTTYLLIDNSNYIDQIDEDSQAGDFYLNDIVDLKGKKPVDGYIKIGDNGVVKKAEFILDGYQVECILDVCKVLDKININDIPEITFSTSKDKIEIGENLKLNLTLNPNKVTPIYESSDENIATVSNDGIVTANKPGNVTITVRAGIRRKNLELTVLPNNSIIGIASSFTQNSECETFKINGIVYTAHVYVFDGDQVWGENKSFGNANDVGTSTANAKNMVIVKVNGNLTINNGATIGAYYNNYGGPKGMLVYVTGTLTNNGFITMTYRGAKAPGQNVYLWKNANNTYETVPAIGAAGAIAKQTGSGLNNERKAVVVNNGSNATGRGTAGGGGGGLAECNGYYYSLSSSTGGRGSSYNGGGGGGGASKHSSTGNLSPINTSGIAGSNAALLDGSYNSVKSAAGGGAGAPAGICKKSRDAKSCSNGTVGTGGLLIVYANDLQLTPTTRFASEGSRGGAAVAGGGGGDTGSASTGGGGSGGGSVNIFANSITNNGVTAMSSIYVTKGGIGGQATGGTYNSNGGNGGNGSFNIGRIVDGSYQAYSF